MKCRNVKEHLDEYIHDETKQDLKILIEEHLSTCKDCSEDFSFLKTYYNEIASFTKAKAPDDFLFKLNQRLEKETSFKQLLRKLFFPLKIKIPLETAGITAIVIFMIILFDPTQSIKQTEYTAERDQKLHMTEKPSQQYYTKRSPRFVLNKQEKTAFSVEEDKKMYIRSRVKRKASAPRETNTYMIAFFITPQTPSKPSSIEIGQPMMSENTRNLQSLSGARYKKEISDQVTENRSFHEKEKVIVKISEDEEFEKDSTEKNTMDKIRDLVISFNGRIIDEEYNGITDLPKSIFIEMPSNSYVELKNGLKNFGSIRNERLPKMKIDQGIIRLKIRFERE